jgi:hypothetical protein
MKEFKVYRYDQVKCWQRQYIVFEAKNLYEAKKLVLKAQENDSEIAAEIIDSGDYECFLETEEATGNYDWTDEDISRLEEIDES